MADNETFADMSFIDVSRNSVPRKGRDARLNRGRTRGAPKSYSRHSSVQERQLRRNSAVAPSADPDQQLYTKEEVERIVKAAVDAAVKAALDTSSGSKEKTSKKEELKVGAK